MQYPLTLAFSGFWRAQFSGSPWLGVTTAGASGGRDLTEATNPPTAGTAQNGWTPANFNGTNQLLTAPGVVEDYHGAAEVTITVVAKVNSVPAPGAYTWDDPCFLVTQTGGTIALGVCSSGVSFLIYTSGGPVQTGYVAFTTGVYHVFQARMDGTNASVRVDGGAWTSAAAADIAASGGQPLLIGTDLTGTTAFIDADLLEIEIGSTAFSDVELGAVLAYAQARYFPAAYTSRCIELYNGQLRECPDTGPYGARVILTAGTRVTAPTGGKSLILSSGYITEAASEVGVRTPP